MSFFSNLSPELSRWTTRELMQWFADPSNLSAWPADDWDLLLDEVAVRIAEEGGADGIHFLLSNLRNAAEPHAKADLLGLSFAAEALTAQQQDEVMAALGGLLDDPRPLVVARAIDCHRHLGVTETRSDIRRLLSHPSPYVVGSVLRFMARHHPDEAIPLLERSLDSPEPIVRENAIDELDELGRVTALPRIKALLNDSDKNVRQAARTAVASLEANLEEMRPAI